jgi:glyoxylase-like metal-dependent hydrolase (beta-lactamase superfamily II)
MSSFWLFLCWFHLPVSAVNLRAPDPLQRCWSKQVQPIQNQFVELAYQEQKVELEHSAKPWQQTLYQATGIIWTNAAQFRQADTLRNSLRDKIYYAQTQADNQTMLVREHGEEKLASVTRQVLDEQPLSAARYSPVRLIEYAYRHHARPDPKQSTTQLACYRLQINQTIAHLFIRRSDGLLDHITRLAADDMLGDLLTTISYSDYQALGQSWQPTQITIDKVNGKLHDQVQLVRKMLVKTAPVLLNAPADYALASVNTPTPTAHPEKYNEHIHFVTLPHTDDRVMIVEFNDFLLVAEAPLNSQNGELIIQQARQLAPTKPIRYFVFGHHHPHYLGGVRAFVHKGATILCSSGNEAYVQYLVQASHQLRPDSLALAPKPLKLEAVGTHKTISDGEFSLDIYHIGNQSAHTTDFLIYHFPKEQLLFEDDLVWIPKTGKPTRVSARQTGLCRAIQALGLSVRTIIQSWPVADMGVKTEIPFAELAASVDGK